jgi:dUTP pyrophosphatase
MVSKLLKLIYLAVKNFIDTGAGVIDFDYRGEVGIVLFNHSDIDFVIKRGDRIAQLILERICMADIEELTELAMTDRGEDGFGSTGVGN